jgi:ubiquinone/menaquinone biosynthesis C-methylase UbiE
VNAATLWDARAETEPYFAVLTERRYLRAHFDAHAESDFFATGDAYVTQLLELVRHHVTPLFEPRSILEFGCGPGRVAIPFAHRNPKAEVVAADVSPAMLRLAAENARRHDAGHVTFTTAADVLASARRFDLVNASLVFHHIPPAEGLPLLARLLQHIGDRGVGAFSFVYRRSSTMGRALARWTRRSVPGANRAANLLLRKPAAMPFLYPYVYNLSDVLAAIGAAGGRESHVVCERHDDLDVATIYVRRKAEHAEEPPIEAPPAPPPEIAPATERPSDFIDVRDLIANASIEELNRTAEQYFAGLDNWQHHLAKPFANAGDTPTLLINVAVLLEGLRLYPGLAVLEFGAGTGWLSRMITQLGCQSILTDVSPTALKIAAELFERQPVIGDRPPPQFVRFDGYRIDVPDASVDRVITFDAFHHVTNPEAVLAEFARVLKPGGIAGFAEPGPHHSKTAQSQFEMRTYGVVENDVDIHALWAAAQKLGFADLKLAAFNARPFHISLAEYDDLLQAGETYLRWANWTREFMNNVRNFYLYKAGTAVVDSRHADSVAGRVSVEVDNSRVVHATLENTGTALWLPGTEPLGGVGLGCHLYREDGTLLDFEFYRQPLPAPLAPGETVELTYELPRLAPGTYLLEFDLVAEGVTWFSQKSGSQSAKVRLPISGSR